MEFERIYRGKRLDNGEWVEGFILAFAAGQINPRRCFTLPFASSVRVELGLYTFGGFVEVDPETVGQCTGIPDKTGKKIFDGDILKLNDYHGKRTVHVFYGKNMGCWMYGGDGYSDEYIFNSSGKEIIGNRWDNPELLGVKT